MGTLNVHAQGVEKQNMDDRVRGSETARYDDPSIDDSYARVCRSHSRRPL